MLGIPTQSDIKDPEFCEIVRREKISDRLYSFDCCFSSCLIHNHIVGAYRWVLDSNHEGKAVWRRSRHEELCKNLLKLVPDERKLLDPVRIANEYLARIKEAREAVFDAMEFLKGQTVTVFTGNDDSRATINVLDTVVTLLDGFEDFIMTKVINSDANIREKTLALYLIVKEFDDLPEKRALWPMTSKVNSNSSWSFCLSHKASVAGRLNTENNEAANISDIFMRFDERYIIHRIKTAQGNKDHMFPMVAHSEDSRFKGCYMSQRAEFRSIVLKVIAENQGCIVINGHLYEVTTVDSSFYPYDYIGKGNIQMLTCNFDADSSQFLANILGIPIKRFFKDSYYPEEVTFPEVWVYEEMNSILAYRELKVNQLLPKMIAIKKPFLARMLSRDLPIRYMDPHPVVLELLDKYQVFGYGLVDDLRERCDVLMQYMRKQDWDKLNGREERVLSESGVSCG